MRKIGQVANFAAAMALLIPPSFSLWTQDALAKGKPALKAIEAAPATAKVVRRKPERIVQAEILSSQGEFSGKTTKELISMSKGFQTLIKAEKNPEKKAKLQMAEAGTYLALARQYRAKTNLSKTEKKNERDASARVIASLSPLVNNAAESKTNRSRAAYLLGLAFLNQNRENEAVRSFKLAIELDPNASYTQALSLFLAEQAFDQDRYQESLDLFKTYFKSYNDSQRALAIYKMAWCYINLDNLPMAEKSFLLIAGKEAAGPFGFDGLKDLAYVMTLHRSESEIIEFTKENFKDDKAKQSEFLVQVYSNFQAQSSTKRKPEILAELTRTEKDPVKRLRILIATLKGSQREFAAVVPYQEFQHIREEIEKTGWKTGLAGWDEMAAELEQELFQLIRANADSLNGKLKPEGGLDPGVISDHLVQALFFHISYYPKSRERENSYLMWMKICDQQKKFKCSFDVSNRIIEDSKVSAELRKTAQMSRLRALDNLIAENPSLKPQLKQSLEQFLKDRKPDADWYLAAKRLGAILSEEKKFSQSIPWLEKIHQKEKSSESNYRLQLARFQMDDFAAVAESDFKLGKDQFSTDTLALVREAHLKLAQKNLAGDQFPAYAKNVLEFLKSNPDSDKADAARRSLLDQYIQRKMFSHAGDLLEDIPSPQRLRSYTDQTEALSHFLLKQSEFGRVIALTRDWAKMAPKSGLELYFVSASAGLGNADNMIVQNAKAREYLLGIWALTDPHIVLHHFEKNKAKTDAEKRLLLLALQVQQKRTDPKIPAKFQASLKSIYQGSPTKGPAKSLADFAKIIYPSAKTNKTKFETLAQTAAEKVRRLRNHVVKDLDGRAAEDQIEILKAAKNAEEQVAEVLKAAPLPEGMNKKETAEYQTAIAELAGEFTKQASEYSKLSQGIEKAKATSGTSILPFPKPEQWSGFSGEAGEIAEKLVKKKQLAGALIVLDQWKADGSLDADKYFQMRSRVLFLGAPNPAVSNYVAHELNEFGQKSLLERWKSFPMEASAAKQ